MTETENQLIKNLLPKRHDTEIMTMPMDRKNMASIMVSAEEFQVTYKVDKDTNVWAPIDGKIILVSPVHQGGFWVILISNKYSYCQLAGLTDTDLEQGAEIIRGKTIGRMIVDEDNPSRLLYVRVASLKGYANITSMIAKD